MPELLTEHEERYVRRVSRTHGLAIVLGLALSMAGGAYAIWGVRQIDPERTPDPQAAFDRPIARLAQLATDSNNRLSRVELKTMLEAHLVKQLEKQADYTMRALLALLRVVLGGLGMTIGLVLIFIGLTQKQLLGIVEKLLKQHGEGRA